MQADTVQDECLPPFNYAQNRRALDALAYSIELLQKIVAEEDGKMTRCSTTSTCSDASGTTNRTRSINIVQEDDFVSCRTMSSDREVAEAGKQTDRRFSRRSSNFARCATSVDIQRRACSTEAAAPTREKSCMRSMSAPTLEHAGHTVLFNIQSALEKQQSQVMVV